MRVGGLALIVAGALGLAWTVTVWRWQDPFTGLYTRWEQHRLGQQYDRLLSRWQPPEGSAVGPRDAAATRRDIARVAAAYRGETHPGQAIGRIVIGRIGLKMVLVNGTDHGSLKRGPGRDLRSYMPGQNRLVYIAGHRTTYLAPFRRIDQIQPGDKIYLRMPYADFTYVVEKHAIVDPGDVTVVENVGYERLVLTACHPLYSATQRYVQFAKLEDVTL